ncbi:MAG: 4Fe-4S cluster-binding domain-containing protein [Oscillospiraceae bacterium]
MGKTITGNVFQFQRFSLHDGQGIRTVVFLKGCPLHCYWCHNPEGIHAKADLMFTQASCILCGACEKDVPIMQFH